MDAPQGFTDIQEAPAKWGRSLPWWYQQVKLGKITGYKLPGIKGTYLKDSDVETYISTPQPKESDAS